MFGRGPGPRRAIGPALVGFLVAAGMAVAARGLAGDEEAGHYLIARYAPTQPELFLSLVGRPLVTAVLSLPSQAGILAARLVSALAAALCGVAVARIAVSTRWIGPFWAVGLLFVQPFFLGHAGTAMTEPWAALILAWALVGFVERRYLLMTCLVALGPLARMEVVTLWPWVIWALLASGRWRLVGILPLPILIWNGLGALWSGDPLWLAHQSNWQAYPQRSALHYLKSFVWIVGAGLFVPVLVGMARTLLLPLDLRQPALLRICGPRVHGIRGRGDRHDPRSPASLEVGGSGPDCRRCWPVVEPRPDG